MVRRAEGRGSETTTCDKVSSGVIVADDGSETVVIAVADHNHGNKIWGLPACRATSSLGAGKGDFCGGWRFWGWGGICVRPASIE